MANPSEIPSVVLTASEGEATEGTVLIPVAPVGPAPPVARSRHRPPGSGIQATGRPQPGSRPSSPPPWAVRSGGSCSSTSELRPAPAAAPAAGSGAKAAQAQARSTGGSTRPSRPASAGSSRPVSRPASAGRHHGRDAPWAAAAQAAAQQKAAIEEELHGHVLTPIPAALATPLERRVAEVLGLADEPDYPRLPLDTEACAHGGRCCWRWLARAALEEVGGELLAKRCAAEGLTRLELCELVSMLREEFAVAHVLKERLLVSEEQKATLQVELAEARQAAQAAQHGLTELGKLQEQIRDQRLENIELQTANARLRSAEHRLEREVAIARGDTQKMLDREVGPLKARYQDAELKLMRSQLEVEEGQRRCSQMAEENRVLEFERATLREQLTAAAKLARRKRRNKGVPVGRGKPQLPSAARGHRVG
eukprot:TRINITY_DN123135_c0_g1_i1.p1 TRINITY_DN123135_c0_g1~~TRINITY_DN123135_c0_g1_i1.p1  ORF type:complete len:424 (+),score=88.38 TRINITY_DN123135_c0_g1_i1:167-1438(+)